MSATQTPTRTPGPSRLDLLKHFLRSGFHFVEALTEEAEKHGDTFVLPLEVPTYIVRNPDDIKHILVSNPLNYHKTGGLTVGEKVIGQGLVSSEEPLHGKQRRTMQPMFHKASISKFTEMMLESTASHTRDWKDGDSIDMSLEMMHLTITIVGLSLFNVDLYREGRELGMEFNRALNLVTRIQLMPFLPKWAMGSLQRKLDASIAKIDEAMAKIIADRRALPESEWPHDLLSMILGSRYEDGTPMPDKLVRDEVVTIILAGHETVANHLNWTWYLLARHPEVHDKLLKEWDEVLGNEDPSMEHMARLPYTLMVLSESMRLYPPAWTLARRVVAGETLPSGLELKPGDELLVMQYVSHRNPKYFPEPEKFVPERFSAENKDSIPKYAYYPFGLGPRFCIGEGFARLEALLLLVKLGRRFRFEMARAGEVVPETLIALRPRKGLPMIVRNAR